MLTHEAWVAIPGLRHGFLGRDDSTGPPWTVAVPGDPVHRVAVPRQVHGTRVLTAGAADARPEADALITAAAGSLVGILTADCVPVLLVDRGRRVAAAVHAGWRGTAGGILEAALAYLKAHFGSRPDDVEAAIGPAIGGCCYEVGDEVHDAFLARTSEATAPAWTRPGERWHVDLREAGRRLLQAAGTSRVTVVGPCTRCDVRFHSYRRDGRNAGRQLSFVGWE